MQNIHNHMIPTMVAVVTIALLTLLSGTAVASEVAGTLSSDGSARNAQGMVLGETATTSSGPMAGQVAQNGPLQGSVVGGRQEGASTMALTDPATMNSMVWAAASAAVLIAILLYGLAHRRNP